MIPTVLLRMLAAVAIAQLAACASTPIEYESNVPLTRADPAIGYRLHNLPRAVGSISAHESIQETLPATAHDLAGKSASPGLFINMTFSGGGTRAAALAYGVLREMRQTPLHREGAQKTLLDAVDVINAVSGGSFPAAYYALYGERLFDDFESRFLRRNVQQELQSLILSWAGLRNALSPRYGRGDMLAEHLDQKRGKPRPSGRGQERGRQRRPLGG